MAVIAKLTIWFVRHFSGNFSALALIVTVGFLSVGQLFAAPWVGIAALPLPLALRSASIPRRGVLPKVGRELFSDRVW